jgi:hypothetical protein
MESAMPPQRSVSGAGAQPYDETDRLIVGIAK